MLNRYFRLHSLRMLLPLALLSFTAVVLGYMYHAVLGYDRQATEQEMLHSQSQLAARLQSDFEYSLRERELPRIQNEFSMLSAQPDIRAALLVDERGMVTAASQMDRVGNAAAAISLYAEHAGKPSATGRTWLSRDHDLVLSVYPVVFNTAQGNRLTPEQAGTLFLAADPKYLLAERTARSDSWMRRVGLLVGLLALLAWLIVHLVVTRRVGRLLHAIELVGKRRTNVFSGVSGTDEIGRLGSSFDRMMRSLAHSSARIRKLSQAVEQSATSIIITNRQGVIEYVNPAFTTISGYSPEEAIGQRTSILKSGETAAETYAQLWHTLNSGCIWRGELRNRRKDGTCYWDSVIISPVRDDEGQIANYVAVQEDITARKEAESRLALTMHIFNSISEGVAVTDTEHNICFVNPAFTEITGYGAAEVIGRNPHLLSSGLMDRAFYREMWRSLNETGHWQGEIIDRRKSGESYPEWLSISTVKSAGGQVSHYVSVFSDISERKAVEERVTHMAQHDFLTGLPNRMLLQDRLVQAITQAEREQRKVAVMFLDLDRFKAVNDSMGHLIGDMLLQQVANRIRRVSRAGDTVCRQGGDEFVIMLPELDSVDDLATIAGKLLESVAGAYQVGGQDIEVTTSIGISVFPEDGSDGSALLQHADTAMYHAKEKGRNNYQFFTSEMNRRALERVTIERRLRRALERDEFQLYYQPQVDLVSGDIVGVEALLRWNNPESGMVPPGQFIPVAEENGMIVPIGEWVLREACRQNSEWRRQGLPPLTMAVNVSAVQLRQKNFHEAVVDALRQGGLDASGLELEITETAVMQDAEAAIRLLHELKDIGVKLAMDDFGTGYSSLGYLKRLPIDKLKIDQSFVRDMTDDPDDAAIVSTIINMARNLKLKPIAEGVETDRQLAFLRQYACDEVQGYYFSKPLPAAEFAEFFRRHRQR